jgi:DNA-binding XRE family transcriptional regulator
MQEPNIEHFERNGTQMIAMPLADWEAVEERLEDEYLSRIANEWLDGPREPGIPVEIVMLLLDGTHPLKAYRDLRNLTQTELADMVGVKQPAIARIENRERAGRPALLAKLAVALDMPLETLIDFGGDYTPTP